MGLTPIRARLCRAFRNVLRPPQKMVQLSTVTSESCNRCEKRSQRFKGLPYVSSLAQRVSSSIAKPFGPQRAAVCTHLILSRFAKFMRRNIRAAQRWVDFARRYRSRNRHRGATPTLSHQVIQSRPRPPSAAMKSLSRKPGEVCSSH